MPRQHILDNQFSSFQAQTDYYTKLIHSRSQWEFAGVYADKASARSNRRMHQFQELIKACRQGNIDLILIKTVSRLGRNTLEILLVFEELKELGVDVFFEVEGLHLKDSNAVLPLTILAGYAQDESESKSYNIKWGLRHSFRTGQSKVQKRLCFGYTTNEDRDLIINSGEAEIVMQIFRWRAEGCSLRKIANMLKDHGIKSPRGKETWGAEELNKLLANEKYTGNVLLQKTFVADFFHGTQVKNYGQLDRYYVENSHPAIIPQEKFDAVQHMPMPIYQGTDRHHRP